MNVLFISFADGSCGNLLAKIIQCMSRGYVPHPDRPFNHMHFDYNYENADVDRYPFINEYEDIWPKVIDYCIAPTENEQIGKQYFHDHFIIPKSDQFPFHIILTNFLYITPLLGVPLSKIIKIQIAESDTQQVSYNFVTKMHDVLRYKQKDTILEWVQFVQENYNKLHWLNSENIDLTDIRLLTWIYWLNKREFYSSSIQHRLLENSQCLTIKLSSLLDKTIVNELDKIAEFCEVPISFNEKTVIENLLDRYISNQIGIPYILKIEDYN